MMIGDVLGTYLVCWFLVSIGLVSLYVVTPKTATVLLRPIETLCKRLFGRDEYRFEFTIGVLIAVLSPFFITCCVAVYFLLGLRGFYEWMRHSPIKRHLLARRRRLWREQELQRNEARRAARELSRLDREENGLRIRIQAIADKKQRVRLRLGTSPFRAAVEETEEDLADETPTPKAAS